MSKLLRIMPYRTIDNRIDGVVITFTDVTASRKVEIDLREKQAVLEKKIAELEEKMKEVQK